MNATTRAAEAYRVQQASALLDDHTKRRLLQAAGLPKTYKAAHWRMRGGKVVGLWVRRGDGQIVGLIDLEGKGGAGE